MLLSSLACSLKRVWKQARLRASPQTQAGWRGQAGARSPCPDCPRAQDRQLLRLVPDAPSVSFWVCVSRDGGLQDPSVALLSQAGSWTLRWGAGVRCPQAQQLRTSEQEESRAGPQGHFPAGRGPAPSPGHHALLEDVPCPCLEPEPPYAHLVPGKHLSPGLHGPVGSACW